MLYTALCGEILGLNSWLAEPGPGPRPTPQNKCFTLPSVVKSWDKIPAWLSQGLALAPHYKTNALHCPCGEILELNSCLAEPGLDPRPAPQNKCFTLPSVVKS
jgi:hypothetical protein